MFSECLNTSRNKLYLGFPHALYFFFISKVMLTLLLKSLGMNAQKATLKLTHVSNSP